MVAHLTERNDRLNASKKSSKKRGDSRMAHQETLSAWSALEVLESRMLLSITAVADAPVQLADGSASYTVHLVADGQDKATAWDGAFTGTMGQVKFSGIGTPSMTAASLLSPSEQAKDSHLLVLDADLGFGLPTETDTSLTGYFIIGSTVAAKDLVFAQIIVPAGGTVIMSGIAANGLGYQFSTNLVLGMGPNRAPVLDTGGSMMLGPINRGEVSNDGTLISTLLASAGGNRITDPDTNAIQGIAVTATDNANGAWQYSTNGGVDWSDMGAVSASSARLLASDGSTRIRFVPNEAFYGLISNGITFQAWDQTSGANGELADASVKDGTTAFSAASRSASEIVGGFLQVTSKSKKQFTDIDGDRVTVSMTGPGTTMLFFDSSGNADASRMSINGTTASSKVTIAVSRKTEGSGRTTMGDITVTDGSLGSLVGSMVDLKGNVSVFGTLTTLTLGNLNSGTHTIETRTGGVMDPKAQLTMKLGEVIDTTVNTNGEPIKALSAVRWTDTGSGDSITAPWMGRLTTTGVARSATPSGNFDANLVLDGDQNGGALLAPKYTLALASVKGDLNSATWDIAGSVGTITVTGATSDWTLGRSDALVTSLVSLTTGRVAQADLYVGRAIGSIRAVAWDAGQIDAGTLGRLTVTGKSAVASKGIAAISGDFGADIDLSRTGAPKPTSNTLSSAVISGNLDSHSWNIVGNMGTLTVGRTAGGTVDNPLTVMATGTMAGLTFGAARHADFWAGMNDLQGETRHAIAGQTSFDNGLAAIKRVTIKGWKVVPAQTFFEDTNFSAPIIGASTLRNVTVTDPSTQFGFWANSIGSLTRVDSIVTPTKTYKSSSALFAMEGLAVVRLV